MGLPQVAGRDAAAVTTVGGMKICIECGQRFTSHDWRCPGCGFLPLADRGFPVLMANRRPAPTGYDASFFPLLADLEERSFWFRARTRLIAWAARTYFPSSRRFLEVGAGTGCVLAGLADAFPTMELHASDPFSEGLEFARSRVARATFLRMDATSIPFAEEFDLIGAFDVLEHIVEDEIVLGQFHRALVRGGGLLLTVPQHRLLWSRQDDVAGHERRYSAAEIRTKVERAGFQVRRMTSFVSLLLPAMLASRFWKGSKRGSSTRSTSFGMPGSLNSLLEWVMDCERAVIRTGISLPAGGSLLLAGEKE